MNRLSLRAPLLGSVACFALASAAAAQISAAPDDAGTGSQLTEIVVTAQKRSESLQKVPISVSAFDAAALAEANIRDGSDLNRVTPGLVFTRGDRNVQFFLRGVGSDVNTIGFESSVAVYMDGVYFPRLSPGFLSLSDVERVEVLKGPQGTLFGRNASAGLINIITMDPKLDKTVAKASVGYGNYERLTLDGYVSVPLGDKVAASFTFNREHQGKGYGVNILTGNKAHFDNNLTLRGKLLFQPGDETKLVLAGYYLRTSTGIQGNTYPGTTQGYATAPSGQIPSYGFYDQYGDYDSLARSTGYGISLKLEQDLQFATLTSTTSYQHIRELTLGEEDYTDRNEFNAKGISPVNTISQEFQLASRSGGTFSWTTGLYYYQSRGKYAPYAFNGLLYGEGILLSSSQRARSYAAYAQGTVRLTDQLSATLGGRFTHDNILANGQVDGIIGGTVVNFVPFNEKKATGDRFTFRAALDYQITPSSMVYASFNRGYKAGTYATLPFDPVPTKAEVLDAYEVGFKTEFFDRRVRLNGAAFYYDIKNPQIQIILGTVTALSNAKSARVKGAEAQLEIIATRELSLHLGGTYLDPQYKGFNNAAAFFPAPSPAYGTLPGTVVDASGTRMIHAPKVQFNAGANYKVQTGIGELNLSADYSYMGNFFWNPDHFLKQKAYGLLSARARLAIGDNVGFSVWGRNLTKEKYVSFAIEQQGATGYPYIPGRPRTYGAMVDFKW